MNTASLELCRELYEITGWEADDWYDHGNMAELCTLEDVEAGDNPKSEYTPAYDLGYLIRKLDHKWFRLEHSFEINEPINRWSAWYLTDDVGGYVEEGESPEDAVAMLCIQLIRKGVMDVEAR
jgi:hypothetical protein